MYTIEIDLNKNEYLEEKIMDSTVMAAPVKKGVTGTTLKIIAIVAMFIDHFAAIFVQGYITNLYAQLPEQPENMVNLWQQSPKIVSKAVVTFIWIIRILCYGRFFAIAP